ncbi:MAG TPA: glycerate kinase [Candidatus Marinimicrobia bacterium]|nr:glycerate kinase [Candidatus Neomarinimicrobiota bacterium]
MKQKSAPIIIAPDSFKGSLSSAGVCKALERGIHAVDPELNIHSVPLSDGGEGFIEIFRQNVSGGLYNCMVLNPLGESITAQYFAIENSMTVVIEMAQASGLTLIHEKRRNPLLTSTFGTGQLIADALDKGFRRFVVGIGGSATNDGGAGMAQALGVRFYDTNDAEITDPMNGKLIGDCCRISLKNLHPGVTGSTFLIAGDVWNPLLGPNGAVYIYARQKGATGHDLPILERNMNSFYSIVEKTIAKEVRQIPGAGAAGGLGAGLIAFLGASIQSGINLVLDEIRFDELIENVRLVITGEGQIDAQTLQGKTVMGVVNRAKKGGVPVIVVAGKIDGDPAMFKRTGIDELFSLTEVAGSQLKAINQAAGYLEIIGGKIAQTINRET